MPNVNIDDKLYQEIKEYCKLNKLTISMFINDLLKKSFIVEKYDDAPPFFKKKKVVEDQPTAEELKEKDLSEPIKKEKYEKPEVISMETKKDEKALTEREKAKQRIQYL